MRGRVVKSMSLGWTSRLPPEAGKDSVLVVPDVLKEGDPAGDVVLLLLLLLLVVSPDLRRARSSDNCVRRP